MEKLKTQIGISCDADFEENKWTFMFPDGYKVSAGAFAITPKEDFDELKKQRDELLEALKNTLMIAKIVKIDTALTENGNNVLDNAQSLINQIK